MSSQIPPRRPDEKQPCGNRVEAREPIDWRYLPTKKKAYVSGYPQKIWPQKYENDTAPSFSDPEIQIDPFTFSANPLRLDPWIP